MKSLSKNARIGIINRGEAAFRFVRAVREYNLSNDTDLKSVAFYVDKEESALFAVEADFSYRLSAFKRFPAVKGPVYLDYDLLIEALLSTGCEGVWVGWGFVSEDADFVKKVEEAGLVFLGPSSKVIALVGDKISSKELAEKSDTPICPWSGSDVPSVEKAYEVAERIGYPCVVKASNAGGGRGIRFVFNKEEMAAQYISAADETERITGNRLMFIERLVETGRHLEVQALADRHGNVRTFGVRDCSAQRKNQKIIEETPPPHLTEETIEAIQSAARGLLSAANYESAGTVEFLYDLKRNEFYFMEVNARLQVEHPITEQLFGIDLVAGQIDVARGLSVADYPNVPRGHVMEVRLNAEDPENGFRPAGGFVSLFRPAGGLGVRIDSGIEEGSTIPPDFDSMVAKIGVMAVDRDAAVARLRRALMETKVKIEGGATNRSFLLELLSLDAIKKGGISTRFVEEYLAAGVRTPRNDGAFAIMVVVADSYLALRKDDDEKFNREMIFSGFPRNIKTDLSRRASVTYEGASYALYTRRLGPEAFCVEYDGKEYYFSYREGTEAFLTYNERRMRVFTTAIGDMVRVEIDNVPYLIAGDMGGTVKAASPGVALAVMVKPGQKVKKGDTLLTLEAMKMELPVTSPIDAIVDEVLVKAGEQVSAGRGLIRLERNASGKKEEVVRGGAFDAIPSEFKDALHWEWRALFCGYDAKKSDILAPLIEKEKESFALVREALEFFNACESLFDDKAIIMNGYTRSLSFAEELTVYYKSFLRKSEDFPAEFNERLREAFLRFNVNVASKESVDRFIFRLYISHACKKEKEAALAKTLGLLAEYKPIRKIKARAKASVREAFSGEIDRLSDVSPILAATARDLRYRLFDKQAIVEFSAARMDRLSHIIDLLEKPDVSHAFVVSGVVNYGSESEPYLVNRILKNDKAPQAMEIYANRMFRDRDVTDVDVSNAGRRAVVTYTRHDGVKYRAIISAQDEISDALAAINGEEWRSALIISKCMARLDAIAAANPAVRKLFCVSYVGETLSYTGFYKCENEWKEDPDRRFFSPLAYREQRVYLFSNFNKSYERIGDNIVLAHVTAKNAPADERFCLFIDVESIQTEVDAAGKLSRVIGLEDRVIEAATALSRAQDGLKRPLEWNRINIFVRPRLNLPIGDIEIYAKSLTEKYLTNRLGLECVNIYLRTVDENGSKIMKELSLTHLQGGVMRCEIKAPETVPFNPRDAYESKISRMRARNLIYPYDVIDAIEEGSLGGVSSRFEEFDLDEAGTGFKSVAGREPGGNTANIVFGLISSMPNGILCERVIILSDPSGDMGSLAEAECRRVNAALDLADSLNLPVEWLPVSSGARIDLDSGTENLDWTAATLKRIIQFTQDGGEINIIVCGTNVGAQSYWNSEATMLMHCKGLLIMTKEGSMLLTGKRALDFSGSVSAENNLGIGGGERIMEPNGEAQIYVTDLGEAYATLMRHYSLSYAKKDSLPAFIETKDPPSRDVSSFAYEDMLAQGFTTIGDILSDKTNGERKKPFDIRQVLRSVVDIDSNPLERWAHMRDAETGVVWETRIGGYACGLMGIESRSMVRRGDDVPFDGPENYAGGTLYPLASKKLARGINAFSGKMPLVVLANLSGFDGSPESLRKVQLEWGAEIGRAIVNFKGSILFVVIGRYHGGAYVVFSKNLNPNLTTVALEGTYASVIGGAPAAAVVFAGRVAKSTRSDKRIIDALRDRESGKISRPQYDDIYKEVYAENQNELAKRFDQTHSVERAKRVGSINAIIKAKDLRFDIVKFLKSIYSK